MAIELNITTAPQPMRSKPEVGFQIHIEHVDFK